MPAYMSTILLLFILGSCFYKQHIREWWWFWFGVITFAVSVVSGELSPGDQSGWTLSKISHISSHFDTFRQSSPANFHDTPV